MEDNSIHTRNSRLNTDFKIQTDLRNKVLYLSCKISVDTNYGYVYIKHNSAYFLFCFFYTRTTLLTVLYVCPFLLMRKLEQFLMTIHCKWADIMNLHKTGQVFNLLHIYISKERIAVQSLHKTDGYFPPLMFSASVVSKRVHSSNFQTW